MGNIETDVLEYIVLDQELQPITVVDLYTSTIWTERKCDAGDFELHMPLTSEYFDFLALGNYLTLKSSDRAMIIESVQIESSIETGEKTALFKGESLESLLKRRIVWGIHQYNTKVENIIEDLLNRNAIRPENSKRAIPRLIYRGSADAATTTYLSSLESVECQFEGDNLFDAVKTLCEQANLGFKITISDAGKFEFRLYYGIDRSAEQSDREAVVFSTEFDNLTNSRYIADLSEFKNVALVTGEEVNDTPIYATAFSDEEPEHLERREMYVNASDLSQEDFGQNYTKALQYRGLSELQENSTTTVFDAEAETTVGPQFMREYFLGDFVTLENEFGIRATAQITEYIRSCDEGGYSAYPTFVVQD